MLRWSLYFILTTGFYLHAQVLPNELGAKNLLDASLVNLNFRDGQKKVVIFLSAQCPCSKSHEDSLAALSKAYPEWRFIGVNSNENENLATVRAHFSASKIDFLLLKDSHLELANAFAALKTPHAFVLSGEGEVLYSGGVTNSARADRATEDVLKEVLEELRSGKVFKARQSRTLGCIIARP